MRANCRGVTCAALTVMFGLSPLASSAQRAPRRQPQLTTEGTKSCLVCHSGDKMQAIRQGAHGELEGRKTPMNEKGCESCHGPGSFHVSRAFGGVGFPPMIRFGEGEDASPRETQLEACLGCHRKAVGHRAATPFIGSPHDNDGFNCSTCHVAHATRDPMTDAKTQVNFCNTCHDMDVEHNESEACSSCHDVHARPPE